MKSIKKRIIALLLTLTLLVVSVGTGLSVSLPPYAWQDRYHCDWVFVYWTEAEYTDPGHAEIYVQDGKGKTTQYDLPFYTVSGLPFSYTYIGAIDPAPGQMIIEGSVVTRENGQPKYIPMDGLPHSLRTCSWLPLAVRKVTN